MCGGNLQKVAKREFAFNYLNNNIINKIGLSVQIARHSPAEISRNIVGVLEGASFATQGLRALLAISTLKVDSFINLKGGISLK